MKKCSDLQLSTNLFCHQSTYVNIQTGSFVHVDIPAISNLLAGLGGLRDILCRFTEVNHDVNTQISLITTGLLTLNFLCNV